VSRSRLSFLSHKMDATVIQLSLIFVHIINSALTRGDSEKPQFEANRRRWPHVVSNLGRNMWSRAPDWYVGVVFGLSRWSNLFCGRVSKNISPRKTKLAQNPK
jgi:hypothetical protein